MLRFRATPRALCAGVAFFLGMNAGRLGAAESVPPASPETDIAIRFVPPSTTDPAIKTFNQPHRIYVRTATAPATAANPAPSRGELLLWLPGTMPAPNDAVADPTVTKEGAAAFCTLAAQMGYDVISLRYPNALSASDARRDEPNEFEHFRMAIIAGGTSKYITVGRIDSIEHRLRALLRYLGVHYPAEGWPGYLNQDGSIRWEKIAVAGQSQGGGHAALIATRHRVARVICTGAPKDFNLRLAAPAAWLAAESATPRRRYFTFNHRQDRQAATFAQQLQNLHAMKLGAFGGPVDVDRTPPPFQHSRILTTDYPGGTIDSNTAHTAVITWRNAAVFAPVWLYMLTASVD